MRNRARANADVEARIAQIEQMTLDQIATFQGRARVAEARGPRSEVESLRPAGSRQRGFVHKCTAEPKFRII